jgi:hypothetical protein
VEISSEATRTDINPRSEETAQATDRNLANELVHLLSSLEQERVKLEQLAERQRPDLVLETLADMVERVSAVVKKELDPQATGPSLLKALQEAYDAILAAEKYQKQLTPTPWQQLLGLFGNGTAVSAKRRKKFRSVLNQCLAAVEECFLLFKVGFATAASMQEWEQTSAYVLGELKQVIDRLDC